MVNQYKALLFINGKFIKVLEAGTYYFWNNEISVEMKAIDARMQQLEIAGQELLTKDKANLRINFYVRYQVTDIVKALTENKEYDKQLYVLMQLALREFVGALTLDELLVKKDNVGKEILENLRVLANELPVYQINRSKMNEYLEKYESKFAKSKQMVALAKQRIPGGVQHNLAFNYPFPLAIAKADGAYLYDVSGNRFIDFLQAGGPTVLGSNY